MKKLITGALTLATLNTFALDTSEDSTRGISDIMYMPSAGTISFALNYDMAKSDSDIIYQSRNVSNTDTTTNDLTAYLGYSVNDNFLLAFTLPYTVSSEAVLKYGPASTSNGQVSTTDSSGMNDVKLSAKYRILSQSDSATNIDLIVELSPKTGDAETASTTKDGNAFSGGTDFDVTLEFGKKLKELQVKGYVGLLYAGETETTDLSDNSVTKRESFMSFQLGGDLQFRPSEQIYLNASLGILLPGDFKATLPTETQEYSSDPVLALGFKIGYDFTQTATLSLGYAITKVNRSIIVSTTNLDNETSVSQFLINSTFQF